MSKTFEVSIYIFIAFALLAVAFVFWYRSSSSRADTERFRDRVLGHMRAAFPTKSFKSVPGDDQVILVDGFQLGLDNLRRKYDLSDKSDQTLKELVRDHLTVIGQDLSASSHFPATFDEARDRIMPQIMAHGIAMDATQVRIPFAAGLFISLVVDDERAYMYITRDTLIKWGKTENDVYKVAILNLDSRSKGMEMKQFTNAGTAFIAVGVADGYDAARILLPGLKKIISESLGGPFCFGIPNRDFLICWSQSACSGTQETAARRVAADFKEQPYPLSPIVFHVSENGTITSAQPPAGGDAGSNARF